MSIKNHKPSKKSGFIQGYFNINEAKKYIGHGPVIFRSSWERKFCFYCERTPNIISWSSEPIVIPYFSPIDSKYHKYYPDFLIKMDSGDVIIIEIKPSKQLILPTPPKRKTARSMKYFKLLYHYYITNMAKKDAAIKYAQERGWSYKIITEKFFDGKSN